MLVVFIDWVVCICFKQKKLESHKKSGLSKDLFHVVIFSEDTGKC